MTEPIERPDTRTSGEDGPVGRLRDAVSRLRRRPWVLLALLLIPAAALVALRLSAGTAQGDPEPREVPLSQALVSVTSHEATKASIDTETMNVTLELKEGNPLVARFPAAYADTLTQTLIDAKVETKTVRSGSAFDVFDLLLRMIPVFLILGLLVYLMRMQSGTSFIGKMKSDPVDVPGTRFGDVAGCDEAVRDLEEIAVLLREPERYAATGGRMPRGYLLVGPPGTGKTLLARAVAGEADLPFFSTSGADFSDTFVGVGKKRIRALFAKARKAAETHGGAVVFFDEIDAVGGARQSVRRDSASDDRDATLIALLTEMDGFEARGNIVVLAATNRPDSLDPALTRPGRFDRQVAVTAPDRVGRTKILQIHSRAITIDEAVDLESLGRRTPGLVGADLEGLVNEAALEAGRRGLERVDESCFEEALATTAMGRARTSAVVTDRDRTITAWHEGGHTLLALVEEHADDPVSVTIIPRGISGGTTWMGGTDHSFMTREQAVARLVVAMGGRAGEELLLDGSYSQGASGDLDGATRLAIAMATEYGMTRLGLARRPPQGPELPADVLEVVNELLAEALDVARDRLREHRGLLHALVEALLDRETLTKADLEGLREAHVAAAPSPVRDVRSVPDVRLAAGGNRIPQPRPDSPAAPLVAQQPRLS